MLPKAIMKILTNASLFASAGIEDRVLKLLAFRSVDSRCDNVAYGVITARQNGGRPIDQAAGTVPRDPVILEVVNRTPQLQLFEHGSEPVALFRRRQQIPEVFSA